MWKSLKRRENMPSPYTQELIKQVGTTSSVITRRFRLVRLSSDFAIVLAIISRARAEEWSWMNEEQYKTASWAPASFVREAWGVCHQGFRENRYLTDPARINH